MFIAEWDRSATNLELYPEKQWEEPKWLERIFLKGSQYFRKAPSLSQMYKFAHRVEKTSNEYRNISEKQIALYTIKIKSDLHRNGFTPQSVIRSFALIREVSRRALGMQHYPAQIIGGCAMLNGMIAEMETGEGKTLTATLPACTAALAGIPVHLITVNDYLVKRDAEWMGPVYRALGLKVGTILEGMDLPTRKESYNADITYCTNKQITFDYLKDRLVFGNKRGRLRMSIDRLNDGASRMNKLLLRGLHFGIVDEADSVLIDEARTPLIISKSTDNNISDRICQEALQLSQRMILGADFLISERDRKIEFTPNGQDHVLQMAKGLGGLWKGQARSLELVSQALTASHLFIKDKHYLIQDEKVLIIDEFTGRVMPDRSWERGLHQMIEAKENVPVTGLKETLAKISYQQFFRRYLHLAGMTGTANEASRELESVYHLKVMRIPTNRKTQRVFLSTRTFSKAADKWTAIASRAEQIHSLKRPVLIGTRSVSDSDLISSLLSEKNLPHQTLNARQDKDEAEVIQQAGQSNRITVATNMAGRGTDIKLAPGIAKLGGLHVIASEPHEARRIDRQLFGRCGRQGDPGSYELFFSLEDELVQSHGPLALIRFLRIFRINKAAESSLLDKIILRWTQKFAERHHAKIRKQLLKLDQKVNTMLAFSGKSE
ncbi:MAG: preprotein translocase subunit SecA [Nitrospinota bacterium]|nr:preprotein translocase subunit SecA [Nitrospinota bacterium]